MSESEQIFISGPPGVGKSHVIATIIKQFPQFNLIPRVTTRDSRREQDYLQIEDSRLPQVICLSNEEFDRLAGDELLVFEHRPIPNSNTRSAFGKALTEEDGKSYIAEPPINRIVELKEQFPNAIIIILKADKENLANNMRERGDSKPDIQTRLQMADEFFEKLAELPPGLITYEVDMNPEVRDENIKNLLLKLTGKILS